MDRGGRRGNSDGWGLDGKKPLTSRTVPPMVNSFVVRFDFVAPDAYNVPVREAFFNRERR